MSIIIDFNFKYFLSKKKKEEVQDVTVFNLVFFLYFKK